MPIRPRQDGVELRVRVTPRGGRDAAEGTETLSDGSRVLKVRVRAVPEDGAANDAARRVLAKAFGAPASSVSLVAGEKSRLKTFLIEGDPGALTARFAALTGRDP